MIDTILTWIILMTGCFILGVFIGFEFGDNHGMAWHPDAAKKRADRDQGVKIQYADEIWILSEAEAYKLAQDIEKVKGEV